VSFNRKTTVWNRLSVADALREAETVSQVDEALVEARLTYKGASAATKRRWEKVAMKKKLALNQKEATTLLGPDGRPVR
jgi:hypothetical protein